MPLFERDSSRGLEVAATGRVAALHARFARGALAIYVAAAVIAVAMLAASIAADRRFQVYQLEERLRLETELRSHYLGHQIGLLVEELRRLGLREEMNLLDLNPEPERILLKLSHEKSTFFNVGVAAIDPDGNVAWSEPRGFLAPGASLAREPWFAIAKSSRVVEIVPVEPDRSEDALVYVVSPILRSDTFSGVLLGGIDLARGGALRLEEGASSGGIATILASRDGEVVYPARPPQYSVEPAWKRIFDRDARRSFVEYARLGPTERVVAAAAVPETEMILLSVADRDRLLASAAARMRRRLGLGLSIALVPLALLVVLFRGSLRSFRRAEATALQEERLRLLGEAANLIAHEIKNSLNGLRMGVDLLVQSERAPRGPSGEKVLGQVRKQIERMSEFTTELLTFSKGIIPRPVSMDLAGFVPKVAELSRDRAEEIGAAIDLRCPAGEVRVRADPSLIHVVVSNLVGNALDALAGGECAGQPRIEISVGGSPAEAWVRVSDNGPGVAKAIRPSLFEPFVSGKPSGVGIGLALSRRIARAHRGDLVLDSRSPGASFLLTLPSET